MDAVLLRATKRPPFFRVLALTATPGGNAEVVQSVIDNLHVRVLQSNMSFARGSC